MVAFNSVIAAATVGAACAFAPANSMMGAQLRTTATARSAVPQMNLEQYKKELAETAKKIASPGEGCSPSAAPLALYERSSAVYLCTRISPKHGGRGASVTSSCNAMKQQRYAWCMQRRRTAAAAIRDFLSRLAILF
jgi:hypothetical protein